MDLSHMIQNSTPISKVFKLSEAPMNTSVSDNDLPSQALQD